VVEEEVVADVAKMGVVDEEVAVVRAGVVEEEVVADVAKMGVVDEEVAVPIAPAGSETTETVLDPWLATNISPFPES
jgi:hypothetical protein